MLDFKEHKLYKWSVVCKDCKNELFQPAINRTAFSIARLRFCARPAAAPSTVSRLSQMRSCSRPCPSSTTPRT